MPITSWSSTAANNNASAPNGAPEGMAPSGVNDVLRQIMADVRSGVFAVVESIAALQAVTNLAGQVFVLGYYEAGDGGGGHYYYDADSAADDNGGTVIAPTAGDGRWIYANPAGAPLSVKQFGAKGDGVTVDTTSLQAAVDAEYAVHVPSGTFIVDGDGIQLRTYSQVTGNGVHSVLKKSADTNPYVLYASTKNSIIIRDLSCDGARSITNNYTNSKFCIYFNDCDNSRISGVHAYGSLCDGIVIEYGENNVVHECHAYNNNKDGIYCSGAEDVTITGNACWANGSNSTGGGIAISATWGASIVGNTCSDNIQFDIILSRGSRLCSIIGNTLGAHLSGQAPISIYILGEQMGGTLHGVNYGDGTVYYGASDCTISNNTCFAEVRLELLNDSVVSGNNINDSNDIGLWLYGCTRVTAEGNKIINYTNTGILLSGTSKNGTTNTTASTVRGNDIYKSGGTAANALSKSGTDNIYECNTLNSQPLETGGSFTPVASSDGTPPTLTYTDQQGSYSVVGDLVFVRARITVNTLTSAGTGNLLITGWPFQSLIKEQAFLTVGRFQYSNNAIGMGTLAMGISSTTAYFYNSAATTGAAAFITTADALKASPNGFSFTVSGCYRIGAA